MSDPRLGLPEVNDYIIELLRNEPNALKCRCLVSKTWDSHVRKHCFGRVRFTSTVDLKTWREIVKTLLLLNSSPPLCARPTHAHFKRVKFQPPVINGLSHNEYEKARVVTISLRRV